MAAGSTAARRARRKMRQRESLIGVAWGARPKPGPASPANVSKRGLSARLYVPNQTLILVNARLPKGNLTAGNQGRPSGYKRLEPGSRREAPGQPERYGSAFSRQGMPEVCWKHPAPKMRAQGRPGARCTRGSRAIVHQECAHEHTGSAESIRPSLRNGFTAYIALSPVNGSFATVTAQKTVCAT
jgi:hypothetical protein